jgi:Cd2+/Zn2+-exporting ATPase
MDLVLAIVCGVLTLVGFAAEWTQMFPTSLLWTIFAVAYFAGSIDLILRTIDSIRAWEYRPDVDLLMLVAAIGAAIIGHPAEGAFLLFLFSLANALEHRAMEKAKRAISSLAELAPATALVLRDGSEVAVPIERVRRDEVVLVKPAERVPVDGVVVSGRSAIDQAPITGESTPVDKAPGDQVFAGTVNGEGVLQVRTTAAVGDRTLDRVIKLVEEAQHAKAPTQRFMERFELIFVPAILILDVLVIVVPPLMGWLEWRESFYRGMALLTGASPCALALGTPATVLAGIAQAARHGVLIKGGQHLESLALIRCVALDKTGTLTSGKPVVVSLEPAEGVDESRLLSVASAVERQSQHPLAKAIVDRARRAAAPTLDATDVSAVTGRGIRGVVEGQVVEIGGAQLWGDGQTTDAVMLRRARELAELGQSVMLVRQGDRFIGLIGVADVPRPQAAEVMRELKSMGIAPIAVLTGDNAGVARAVAAQVPVDEVHANLLPEQKVEIVRELARKHRYVAMVGDGVNDAPALAAATIGIAMGGAGTAAALETADAALMGDDLGKLPYAIALGRRARDTIRQNIAIALSVIVALIVLSIGGWVNIGAAVFLHEGSTLVVIGNALRLLTFGESSKPSRRLVPEIDSAVSGGVPVQAATR